jgi:hypothetical protein
VGRGTLCGPREGGEETTLDVGGGGGGPRARQEDATSIARKYHNMVLGGSVRAAVRMVTQV